LFGENPHINHLINVLLYLITAVFLFFILKKLLIKYNSLLPFIITLLFIAHPIHTEVVASLKNREEILSFLGSLASLYFIMKFYNIRNIFNLIIGIIFFIFAYLSKESAIVFILIIPLTIYFFSEFSIKKILLIFILLLITGVTLRIIINTNLPPVYSPVFFENPLNNSSIWLRLSTGMLVLGFYLKMLIFPHPLLFYYGYNMIPIEGFGVLSIALLILHLGIFVYAIIGFKKKKLLSYAIFYYLFCISMFTNIILPINGIVGERFVYSASLGFAIALAVLLFKISKIKIMDLSYSRKSFGILVIAVIIILIPYSAKTISRNNAWLSHYSLYSNDIEYLKNSAKANELISDWMFNHLDEFPTNERQDAIAKIEKHYKRSLKVYPDNAQANNNLGTLYLEKQKNPDSAIVYFNKCLKADSVYTKAHFNIAQCYTLKKNEKLARYHYDIFNSLDTLYFNETSALSIKYLNNRKFQEAINLNYRLNRIDPSSEVPYYNFANIYILMGDTVKGLMFAERYLEINPYNTVFSNTAGEFYKTLGDTEKANFYFDLAEKYKNASKENE